MCSVTAAVTSIRCPNAGWRVRSPASCTDRSPARFLYHLGDLVYPHGEQDGYRSQFWGPYADYRAPIFAVPGNHDADRKAVREPLHAGSVRRDVLLATRRRCTTPRYAPPRPPSRQPNVYWTLVHPWLRIIGLYTNVPEGGQLAGDQLAWLVGELRAAPADTDHDPGDAPADLLGRRHARIEPDAGRPARPLLPRWPGVAPTRC